MLELIRLAVELEYKILLLPIFFPIELPHFIFGSDPQSQKQYFITTTVHELFQMHGSSH